MQKPCIQEHANWELNSHGRETKGVCDRMDGNHPGYLCVWQIQGHLLQFSQKLPPGKPAHECEVKVPKTWESIKTADVRSILSEGIIDLGPGNKGFFTYSFLIPKTNEEIHFIMSLKLLNQYITCTNFKMTTQKQIREAIHLGQWTVSFNIKSTYYHIPIAGRHHCFLCFKWKGKVYQFKTLLIGLSTTSQTFMRVMKPIFHLCWKMGMTIFLFLYLDDAVVLANSYTQAKEDGQREV